MRTWTRPESITSCWGMCRYMHIRDKRNKLQGRPGALRDLDQQLIVPATGHDAIKH